MEKTKIDSINETVQKIKIIDEMMGRLSRGIKADENARKTLVEKYSAKKLILIEELLNTLAV